MLTPAQRAFVEIFSLYMSLPRWMRDEQAMTDACQRALDDLVAESLDDEEGD